VSSPSGSDATQSAEQVLQVGVAGGVRTEQREVVAQRRPEQVDVLRDDGDPSPQRSHP
jgi:hypothetical protein